MASRELYPSGAKIATGALAGGTVSVILPDALVGRTKILSVGIAGAPGGVGAPGTYYVASLTGGAVGATASVVTAVVNSTVAGETSTVAITYLP